MSTAAADLVTNWLFFANPMTAPVPLALSLAESAVAVAIGGANVDFKCQTLDGPIYGTSNPERHRTSLGGVRRNTPRYDGIVAPCGRRVQPVIGGCYLSYCSAIRS